MPRTPDPGALEPAREEEPWLNSREVAELWPVREEWLPGAAGRAEVRVRRFGGESRGTYGAAPTYYHYHPGDARRAATAITEGRVDIPSVWRTDTPDGRRAEYWGRFRFRLTCAVALVWLLLCLGLAIYAVAS
ncbi:hypothetical protein CW362_24210 [Streptomyces populi]|uniref:Uncharacterized protein n=1 Tax=Streptomyces populi TaxID=2058924 RepID=A0A2I0SKP3_9ACTN|nr:hypothetical protein [Streptomyces populi]PKT70464.1 hypothetical protein CW362_24210 [Streptomyces populi]